MIQRYKNMRGRLLGLCLVILAVVSCTYDYFEDENNFKIYIPQIKEGSVENVLVAIHDASGSHCYTRFIKGPFDPNTIGRDGILRFKLPWGYGYKVSAFANVDETCYDSGHPHQNSHVSEPLLGNAGKVHTPGPDFRVVLQDEITVYPMDHPLGAVPDTVNLAKDSVYKASVLCEFHELPAAVARIDIQYKGVGTHMCYDGYYRRPTDGYVLSSHDVASAAGSVFTTGPDHIFPSEGTHYMDPDRGVREPMDLVVRFYDAGGGIMGEFSGFDPANPPTVTDPDGNAVPWDFYLDPRHQVKFVFKGFFVFSVELVGWGDIEQGEVTPM